MATKKTTPPTPPADAALAAAAAFEPLREQLLAAARTFEPDARNLSRLLELLVEDVERASAEPLTILPVAHHSPACAVHVVQRLRERPPRVVFIELCEDLQSAVEGLKDCKLPVALQAFANTSASFPEAWLPISVVAPLTEFSAEYQAIAWALNHKDVEVVFVDRSVDHVFQWLKPEDNAIKDLLPSEEDEEGQDEEALLHSTSIGLEVGTVEPSFEDFRDFLLQNARVNHFSEWWDLYVEQPTLHASFEIWRQTFLLVGSLIRRLGTRDDKLEEHRLRERFMWTRMKDYLKKHDIAPADAVYICGAAHAAADVEQWGTASDATWDIPERSQTDWLYGFIPSSHSAIEFQFGHPRGTLALAEGTWDKALKALDLKPFSLHPKTKGDKPPKAEAPTNTTSLNLFEVMSKPPALAVEDREQLLHWCTRIVELARENRYLATTADAIAIYETSVLLAGLRGRRQPSPYDFVDAAVTCLEKMDVPGKRDVRALCGILIGADRVGQVGYSSLPPLVQDIYDRLLPLGVTAKKSTVTRWLADFRDPATQALKPASDLLWRIFYLLPTAGVARPIMGEKKLGGKQLQESWDIKIHGVEQRAVIQLAYEGVTVEQVLEQRIRKKAFKLTATTVDVLTLAEDAILYLDNPRLNRELGQHAVHLLTQDMGAQNAAEVFDRVRRFVHYFRTTPGGLPDWLKEFVATGYQHYATLLPQGFQDRGTNPEQLAGMLAFLFTLESLALSLGCNRTQVKIAIQQAAGVTSDPPKQGLLWAAEWLLQLRDGASVREEFDLIFENPMSFATFPAYLGGFILALHFTPLVAPVAVDLLSRAFADLPDAVLLPWLPNLVTSLKEFSHEILPGLFKESFNTQPRNLKELDVWSPPWLTRAKASEAPAPSATPAGPTLTPEELTARALLFTHRDTTNALASDGAQDAWTDLAAPVNTAPTAAPPADPHITAAQTLLKAYPETMTALS